MKRRNGIAFLAIALVILIFATLTAVFIFSLSKDIYRSQSLAIKAKTLQYPKIAVVSMKNLVDISSIQSKEAEVEILDKFFLKLETPVTQGSNEFFIPFVSSTIWNFITFKIEEATETSNAATLSLYAMIDSTQTNLIGTQATTTLNWYTANGNVFTESSVGVEIYPSNIYTESVIYKFK